jgi:hypothetical protein
MNVDFIKTLLHQSESDTLDFKRDQYELSGADKSAKSEIIKDILAMANAWKTTDAYLLIGVDENPGGKAKVVGVSGHLDDANLQQLVNANTNRPVRFAYIPMTVEDKAVGVIRIDQDQDRPLFLTRDYGSLKKGAVKIRRGTSTDEADADEIAEMGVVRVQQSIAAPVLEFEFAEPKEHRRLGHAIVLTPVRFTNPPQSEAIIESQNAGSFTSSTAIAALNQHFERQKELQEKIKQLQSGLSGFFGKEPTDMDRFRWRQETAALCAVGFWARNTGLATANDARAVISGPMIEGLNIFDEADHPSNVCGPFGSVRLPIIHSDVRYAEHGDNWSVTVSLGKLQPQAEFFSNHLLYMGTLDIRDIHLEVTIYADNLQVPVTLPLDVAVRPFSVPYDEATAKGLDRCKCIGIAQRQDRPSQDAAPGSELRDLS